MELVVWKGSDTLLVLEEFKDEITGSYITGATVTANVKDNSDDSLIVSVGAFTDQGSGRYTGLIPDTTTFTEGQQLRIELTADGGADKKLYVEEYAVVQVKDGG